MVAGPSQHSPSFVPLLEDFGDR